MPPSKPHEDAIAIIRETLKDEFEANNSDFCEYHTFFKKRPDLILRNPKTKRFVVVEVGNTDAEKIALYLSIKDIEEIRWYTKYHKKTGIGLSGQWFTDDLSKTYIMPKSCRLRGRDQQIKHDLKYMEDELKRKKILPESYVCCAGCGCHLQIQQILVIYHYNRWYAVCPSCKEEGNFTTASSQRDLLYQFINEQRKLYRNAAASNG